MKKLILLTALSTALTMSGFTQTDTEFEADSQWSGGLELASTNKYLWRGMTVNDGFILQPCVWLTYQSLTFTLWNSTTLTEPNDDIKRPEVDATLSYELEWQNFAFESFFSYYHYINQVDATNTGEVGLDIGYTMGLFTLSAAGIVDVIDSYGSFYFEQKLEAEKDFGDHWTAYSALTLGEGLEQFNDFYFGMSRSTFSLLSFDARLSYTFDNGFYAQPYFQVNKTLDSDLESYIKKHTNAIGLALGREF